MIFSYYFSRVYNNILCKYSQPIYNLLLLDRYKLDGFVVRDHAIPNLFVHVTFRNNLIGV